MPDYKDMYFKLAAKVADTIDYLVKARQEGENAYIEGDEPNIVVLLQLEEFLPTENI